MAIDFEKIRKDNNFKKTVNLKITKPVETKKDIPSQVGLFNLADVTKLTKLTAPKTTTQPTTTTVDTEQIKANALSDFNLAKKIENIETQYNKATNPTLKKSLKQALDTLKANKLRRTQPSKVQEQKSQGIVQGAKDITNILGSAGAGIVQGAANVAKQVTTAQDYVGQNVVNLLNQITQQNKKVTTPITALKEASTKVSEKAGGIIETAYQTSSTPVTKKATELAAAIGAMAPGIAGNIIAPGSGLGTSLFVLSAGGSYLKDAEQRGMEGGQALAYSSIMGLAEGLTERIGLGKLGSALKNISSKAIGKGVTDILSGAGINAVQEALIEPVSEATTQALGGKHDYKDIGKRMLESGVDGALVYLIMGGIGSGFVKSTEIGDKLAEGKPISEGEVKEAVAEMDKAGVDTTKIKNSYNDKVKELVENKDKIIEAENKKEEQVVNGLKQITQQNNIEVKKPVRVTGIETKQEEKVENIPVKEKGIIEKEDAFRLNTGKKNSKGVVENDGIKKISTEKESNVDRENNSKGQIASISEIEKQQRIQKTPQGEIELVNPKIKSQKQTQEFMKKNFDIDNNIDFKKDEWLDYDSEQYKQVNKIKKDVQNLYNIEDGNGYKWDLRNGYKGDLRITYEDSKQSPETFYLEIYNDKNNTYSYMGKIRVSNHYMSQYDGDQAHIQLSDYKTIQEVVDAIDKEVNNIKEHPTNPYYLDELEELGIADTSIDTLSDYEQDSDYANEVAIWKQMIDSKSTEVTSKEVTPTEELDKVTPKKKQKQLSEIAKMEKEEAGIVQTAKYKKETSTKPQAKERGFYKNVAKSNFISEEVKSQIESSKYDIKTNQESLDEAYHRLEKKGVEESNRWLSLDLKKDAVNETDIAEGYILYENAIQNNQLDTAFMIIDKLGAMGTKTAKALQIFSLLGRLTPAGMIKYVQKSLDKAFDVYSEKKTKEWIDNNREKFKLTEEDADFISRNMKAITEITDKTEKGIRQKQILLGEISKIASDKLPPEKGQSVKAYLRIAMLFNPKTQIRNILGNVGLVPITFISDTIASKLDKQLAKTTKIRTTTPPNIKVYAKGVAKGISLTIDDFIRRINTNVMGNRYEIIYDNNLIQSKSFNENTKSKTLNSFNNKMNSIDRFLSTVLTLGDRPFYEAASLNSIEGQMKANNVNVPTSTMIDIATNEALERTWQDNNEFTKAVLDLRKNLNKLLTIHGYGLGDILIPFAKTPANLTRAIVKYSPLNAVSIAKSYDKYKKALSTGEDIAKAQKKLVDDFGKTLTGTLLYLIGYALAQLGFTSGDTDKNKSLTQFEKNVMGKQPYSIKVGDTTITYDWIIPGAVPFGIMAELSKKEVGIAEKIRQAFVIAGDTVVHQSFLASINKVISDYDGTINGLINAGYDLPARFIPTILKQTADVFDGTVRTSYVYDNQLKTMANKLKVKTPGLSQTVEPLVNVMGEEVKRSDNIAERIFTAFLSPAMVGKSTASKEAEEIYSVYQEVGDNAMIPKVAPNYITYKKEKVTLTPKEKTEWQKTSGEYVQKEMAKLINKITYKNASDEYKSKMISNIIDASYDIAKLKFLKERSKK